MNSDVSNRCTVLICPNFIKLLLIFSSENGQTGRVLARDTLKTCLIKLSFVAKINQRKEEDQEVDHLAKPRRQ